MDNLDLSSLNNVNSTNSINPTGGGVLNNAPFPEPITPISPVPGINTNTPVNNLVANPASNTQAPTDIEPDNLSNPTGKPSATDELTNNEPVYNINKENTLVRAPINIPTTGTNTNDTPMPCINNIPIANGQKNNFPVGDTSNQNVNPTNAMPAQNVGALGTFNPQASGFSGINQAASTSSLNSSFGQSPSFNVNPECVNQIIGMRKRPSSSWLLFVIIAIVIIFATGYYVMIFSKKNAQYSISNLVMAAITKISSSFAPKEPIVPTVSDTQPQVIIAQTEPPDVDYETMTSGDTAKNITEDIIKTEVDRLDEGLPNFNVE